jgi:HEAT repeat protein
LQEIGEPAKAAVPRMKALVENDPSPTVKCAALVAYFAAAPKDDALPGLLEKILSDPTPEVRGCAAQIAGLIGPRAAATVPGLKRLLDDDAYEPVMISLDFASSRAVRSVAARALGGIGPAAKTAVGRLTEMMTSDPDHEVRASVALAVFRIEDGNSAAMAALIACLKEGSDESGDPRAAAYALAELGPKAAPAFDALTESLKHCDESVRSAAVYAIASIGGPEAVKRVATALDDQDWIVRETAAESLGDFGPAAAFAVPRLIELLRDTDEDPFLARGAAIKALGKVDPAARAALPALQAIAKAEPDSTDGQLAAEAVERISAAE